MEPMDVFGSESNRSQMAGTDPTGAVHSVESQASLSQPAGQQSAGQSAVGLAGPVGEFGVCSEATSGWTRRVRIGKVPAERELNPNRKSALELSVRAFVEKRDGTVVNPAISTSFDSLDEAFEFYDLYSWEIGFGVRYAKSRLNVNRAKYMQEIVCACAGKPVKENNKSSRNGCTARVRLLRSADNGWYIYEHRTEHNHPLSVKCGEKLH